MGLADHVTKYPHQPPGGQQQRVALARALAIEPRVLLLDEPLSALDAKVRAELRDQIRALQQRLAITTVFVTHDQEEALSMADRVCVMSRVPPSRWRTRGGALLAAGNGVRRSVRWHLEPGSRSLVTVTTSRCLVVRCQSAAIVATVPSGDLDALLRPEDLDVQVEPERTGRHHAPSFLGATTRVGVGIAGANLRVDVRSSQADELELGTRVDVSVNARDVLVTTRLPTS